MVPVVGVVRGAYSWCCLTCWSVLVPVVHRLPSHGVTLVTGKGQKRRMLAGLLPGPACKMFTAVKDMLDTAVVDEDLVESYTVRSGSFDVRLLPLS